MSLTSNQHHQLLSLAFRQKKKISPSLSQQDRNRLMETQQFRLRSVSTQILDLHRVEAATLETTWTSTSFGPKEKIIH